MIDTSKYEGHTPSPWVVNNPDGEKSLIHSVGGLMYVSSADTRLIADAPLLLAEVKRWRKVRDYILEKASYPTVKKLHLKDLLNFMEEVIE